jgi:pilus assembly protein CpaB
MLSTKHIIYLTFCLTLTGLVGIYWQITNVNSPKVEEKIIEPQVSVLTINSDIEIGQALKSNQVSWKLISQSQANSLVGVIIKKDFKLNRFDTSITRHALKSGNYLHFDDMVSPNDSDFLTSVLDHDKRAIAIKVDAKAAIAGLIRPGDRVDVMFYHHLKKRADQDNWLIASSGSARQLVSNVRLLAVDRKIERQDQIKEGKHQAEKFNEQSTVTLEVSTLEAEQLALAQELGQLSLLLRSVNKKNQLREQQIKPKATTFSDVLTQFNSRTDRANMVLMKGKYQLVTNYKYKEEN